MADFPRRQRQEKRILSLAEAIAMVLESDEYIDSNSDDSSGEEYVPTAEDLEEMEPPILPSSRRGSGMMMLMADGDDEDDELPLFVGAAEMREEERT
ncbi:hypothetical protein E2C01_016469 [Portunus trituberculatus]|uniref:Uncharacterized protein n=1 Tax=Portunus trituberculatus TaxID=210409 RepID=A0A5B7DP68_PORTR|nr:hypothetical protein [Portunus trituberculatus]